MGNLPKKAVKNEGTLIDAGVVLLEIILGILFEGGFLKEISILKTAAALNKAGKSFKEYYSRKKINCIFNGLS